MSLEISAETTFLLDMVNLEFGPVKNVSNCENGNYDTFANGTPTGFDAIYSTAGSQDAGTADEISIVTGTAYLVEFTLVLNSGTAPTLYLAAQIGGASSSNNETATAGSNIYTLTSTDTRVAVLNFRNQAATDYEITSLSVREIL